MRTTLSTFAIAIAACLSLAGRASAQRAIVLDFTGPASGAVRGEVVDAIQEGGWEVASSSEVSRASTSVGADAASREVAAEVGASTVVEGRVVRRGRRFTLRTTVRDASSGAVLTEDSFSGLAARGLRAAVRRGFWDRAGGAMAGGSVPQATAAAATRSTTARTAATASTTDTESADEQEEQDAPDAAETGAATLTPLWVAVGGTGFARDFSYTDDLFLVLRPYQLPGGVTARAQARWYPAAHFTQDFAANLGVDAMFGAALGLRSRQRDGTTFGTESIDFRVGADVRIPLAPVEIGVGFGYGMHTFALGPSEDGQSAQLPNVRYQFLRPSVRARFDVGAGIYTEASFGWRVLTGTGALSTWFPRNSGSGMDLGAYVGWESDLGLGARIGFEMQRYFFSMNPEPGDANVAGGATDQFLAGSIDLVWAMR